MARTKGTYSLPANVEVLAGAPLDARDRVATKADLTTSGTFPYPYVGMETFVVSEGKKYRLIGENPTVLDNWEELGSGILEGAKTVTGNPITLADGSDSYAEDLSVIIEPIQDLHGYDHPWVGGAGKNKLHVTMDSSTIDTFSIVVNSDGSVTFNGTAPSDIQNILADEYPTSNITIPSGTYKLNGGIAGVTILVYADNALIYMGSATSDSEFTIPSGISSSYVSISIASGSIFSNVTMYPMVRLSTVTDGTFEPWANVCPITGYTECEVDSVGKNLFDVSKASQGKAITWTNASLFAESGSWTSDYLEVEQNTNYIANKTIDQLLAFDGNKNNTYTYKDGDWVSGGTAGNGCASYFSVPSGVKYIRFSRRHNTSSETDSASFQLEKGTQPTTYEPYHSSNATIQFGQTVYGGMSNFTNGGTTDDRSYGTVTITSIYDASNANVDFAVFSVSDAWAQVGYLPKEFISNMAILSDQTFGTETKVGRVHVYSTNNKQLAVSVPKGSTLPDAQTLFSGMTYCYKKATPTTIDTPSTDLKLLKGTNNLTSNGTTINLKYWPDTVLGDVLAASEAYTDRNKGEGGGAGAVKGYYKTADGKFYEESTYTTEITPDASLLYLDLSTEKIYDCDGTNYTLVTTDEKVTAETKDPTDATWYGITFVNRTITNQKPYVNSGLSHYTKKGTTTDKGISMFQIGNDISTGTTDNKYGVLRLQSEKSGCADIKATAESTSIRTFTLPDKSGTIALTSDLTDEKVTGQVQNPTSGTTYNVPFIGTTNQKPYYNNGFQYTTLEGTANAGGYSQLVLGNSTSTGTAGNKRGSLVLYSEKNGNVTLRATGASTNGRDIYFPDKAGTVALTSDITSDTIPSAYCATPAGTAAKLASCSSFALNSNSYIHVLIANSNTSASALTLNINNTGAKTICINGSLSSSSNYTLPAGTYIVRYDGTHYYFRTDGRLTASITGSADSATKVYQSAPGSSGYSNWRPLLVSDANSATEGFSPSNITGSTYIFNTLSCQPSTGAIRASIYKFNSDASLKYNSTTRSIDFVFA